MLTVHPTASVQDSILQDYKSSYGINAKHEILAEWNLNSYIDIKTYGVIDPNYTESLIQELMLGKKYKYSASADGTLYGEKEIDYEAMELSPLSSVFKSKTTDSNIILPFGSPIITNSRTNIDYKKLSPESIRHYPVSKISMNKYWSSSRRVPNASKNQLVSVGLATSTGDISYADVYVLYSASAYMNKIKVKTQYAYSFPSKFTIYITESTASIVPSSSWTSVYSYSGTESNSPLKNGNLELYWNGTQWIVPDNYTQYNTEFSSSVNVKSITGIRIKVEKMYSTYANIVSTGKPDFQLLELSPRLICNISSYVKGFSVSSNMSNSNLGMPVSGIINSTGTITLSNVDKYFNLSENSSIFSKYLYPNVKFSINSIVTKTISGTPTDIRVPIKTMYAEKWQQNDKDFEVEVEVEIEDYIKFFKTMSCPDVVIANIGGVRSSVAILSLLDAIGYGKYQFSKTSSFNLNEDPTMQFFYSRKENTVAQTLEEIAVSCQLSMFIDANNNFIVMSKEKSSSRILDSSSLSWWFVADPSSSNVNAASQREKIGIQSGSYISNILDISKQVEYPITDINVSYSGLGIRRLDNILKTTAQTGDFDAIKKGELSIIAPNNSTADSFKLSTVWSGTEEAKDALLFSCLLDADIEATIPNDVKNLTASVYAKNEDDAIRNFLGIGGSQGNTYKTASPQLLEIKLISEDMFLLSQTNTYDAYFMVDSENIRFRGIKYIISLRNGTTTSSILFSEKERLSLEATLNINTMTPVSLITYLDFDQEDAISQSLISDTTKLYLLKGHGRATETYAKSSKIDEHKSSGSASWWQKREITKMYDSVSFTQNGSFNANTLRMNYNTRKTIQNGKLHFTGFSSTPTSTINFNSNLPILYEAEKFIYALSTPLTASAYNVISTRLRLISQNQTQTFKSANAGIFFSAKNFGTSTFTGYFVELVSFGNLTQEQIITNNVPTLYLYKVSISSGSLVPTILGSRVVTATSVPETSDSTIYSRKSLADVSDLRVVNTRNEILVYWEDQLAIKYTKTANDSIFNGSTTSGLFVRGNTKAIFDYFLATKENKKEILYQYGSLEGIPENTYETLLSKSKSNAVLNTLSESQKLATYSKNSSTYYDDFGKSCKQVKKFSTRFDTPVLNPKIIDFGANRGRYAVSDFKANAFGAEFWVTNYSSEHLAIGNNDSLIPIIIAGYRIEKINNQDSSISLNDIINANENEFNKASPELTSLPTYLNIQKNKEKYGEMSVSLEAEYISSRTEALELANWISNNKSTERLVFDIDTYPNPLLEIGDKVGLFYYDKGFMQSIWGIKSFIIASIEYSVSESGPAMRVQIKELY